MVSRRRLLACGLVKNLALLAHVTHDDESVDLESICFDLGTEEVTTMTGEEINAEDSYLVFLNGIRRRSSHLNLINS